MLTTHGVTGKREAVLYDVSHDRRPGSGLLGRLLTRFLVGVLTLLLLGIAFVLQPSLLPAGIRDSLGLGPRTHLLASGGGSYKFLMIQPGTHDMPVTYDSCQTLHYVINSDSAPSRFADGRFVRDAVQEISEVSGLEFRYDGKTHDRFRSRSFDQGPILISFDTLPDEASMQDAVAMGGSATLAHSGKPVYATGDVTFKRDYFDLIASRPDGYDEARAIALHELGHVLGLDHVDDTDEIMYPTEGHVRDLGPGDRTGLKILGSGPCY